MAAEGDLVVFDDWRADRLMVARAERNALADAKSRDKVHEVHADVWDACGCEIQLQEGERKREVNL